MDLQTLANLSQVFGAAVVVGSIGFAFVQLAHFRRQRYEMVTVELMRSLQTPEFTHAIRLVLSLPDDASPEKVREDPKVEDAAMLISLTIESVAILVHRRMASLELVWELMGGVCLETWVKTRKWAADVRREQENEKFQEWFQWLCEQMTKSYAPVDQAAHVKYRDWKPRAAGLWSWLWGA
jgi:hypothetical protein